LSANNSPIFPLTPNLGGTGSNALKVSAANTNRDGTGTIVSIITAGAAGTIVTGVNVQAQGTTTVGQVRLFVSNGTTIFLYEEIAVTAITPSASVQAFFGSSTKITASTPLILPTGWSLQASTHNAEAFNVFALSGDY
jgi:hypothetical protein